VTGTETIVLTVGCVAMVGIAGLVGIVVVRRFGLSTRAMRRAARRLGGRLEPGSAQTHAPALLVELDGVLVRAGLVVSDGAPASRVLELCTPVDGVSTSVVAVRRSSCVAVALVDEDLRRQPATAFPSIGVAVYGANGAAWAARVLEGRRSWVLLELDSRMLRVVAADVCDGAPDARAVESVVREFAACVPGVLEAAGATTSG